MPQQPSPFRVIPPKVIAELVRTLDAHVSENASDGELARALRAFMIEVRHAELQPQQLLVGLNDLWHELPAVRAVKDPRAREQIRQRVVKLSIDAYYAKPQKPD